MLRFDGATGGSQDPAIQQIFLLSYCSPVLSYSPVPESNSSCFLASPGAPGFRSE